MNIIETRPVGKVILNENTPQRKPRVERYFIPYYQRGYSWEPHHVRALLDDLDSFIAKEQDYYCLQPVVTSPGMATDGFAHWEVIDGQQRLITLYIIFKFIGKTAYTLEFDRRGKSTEFLKNLSDETLSNENPDFHFMSDAWRTVKEWFEAKGETDISYVDDFYAKATRKVQVIWYQLPEMSEDGKIDIFNRLNIGKIQLTDAELIRALLLSKIRYKLSVRESLMRQAELSSEWNQMEYYLQQDEFWYFLANKPAVAGDTRIQFLFNLVARENPQKYSTYLWFEKFVQDENESIEAARAFELWDRVKNLFAKLRSWYRKRHIYHYTGFLLAEGYGIHKLVDQAGGTKSAFEDWLIKEIQKIITTINLRTLTYRDAELLHRTFLLLNVLTTNGHQGAVEERFPFNLYKKTKYETGGWSIEHIHAQQSEPMKEEKAMRGWLNDTLEAIEHIPSVEVEAATGEKEIRDVSAVYGGRIQAMLDEIKIDADQFNILKDELIALFNSNSIHDLDNLALLSGRHNAALNNSIFPVKRNKLIALEKAGYYIPVCTRNIFLKFYSNADTQPYYWSSDDKAAYFAAVDQIFIDFSTFARPSNGK